MKYCQQQFFIQNWIFLFFGTKITISPCYVRQVSPRRCSLMAKYLHIHIHDLKLKIIQISIFSFLTCPVLVKFPALSDDHRAGTGNRGFRVPARWRKLLETEQTVGSKLDCYMSKNMTKYSDINQLSV